MTSDKQFLWGVVNIGQQTEGFGKNSNWDVWAGRGVVPEIKGANSYWKYYKKYNTLIQELGCNAVRITVEWSRIEPQEGVFDECAVNHYEKIIDDLHNKKIKVVVGLWHWSVPYWFEKKYGLHSLKTVNLFLRFAKYVEKRLGDKIDIIVVLNEPSVFISSSYLAGKRPPFIRSWFKALVAKHNLIKMHKQVYLLWKERNPGVLVGSTFLYNDESPRDGSIFQNVYLKLRRLAQNELMIYKLLKYSDYIGVNYYTSDRFFFGYSGGKIGLHGTNDWHSPDVWRTFAGGLYGVLMQLKKYNKPIFIMENGKPTNSGIDDNDRQELLKDSIKYMKRAIDHGADVKGYFHYSLVDSYEWDSGYDFKFGLLEFDRKRSKIIKRKSYDIYKKIIQV